MARNSERTGSGVYYGAALTEARMCSEQHVVIIGAANSAELALIAMRAGLLTP